MLLIRRYVSYRRYLQMQIYVIYVLKEVLDIHILINYNSFMNFVDLFLHIFLFFFNFAHVYTQVLINDLVLNVYLSN